MKSGGFFQGSLCPSCQRAKPKNHHDKWKKKKKNLSEWEQLYKNYPFPRWHVRFWFWDPGIILGDPICPPMKLRIFHVVKGKRHKFWREDKWQDVHIKYFSGYTVHAELKIKSQAWRMEDLELCSCQSLYERYWF